MNKVFITILVCCCISCHQKKPVVKTDKFLAGKPLAELTNKQLEEISGLIASINNPGALWAINDSGNDAQIFLLNEKLEIKLTCTLKGVKNRDWEDITIGRGPDSTKSYLYIADIGDNNARFKDKYIYRLPEPIFSEGVENLSITAFDTITFQLPEEKKDLETLLLDPATLDLLMISKREEPVYLYRIRYPFDAAKTLVAEEVLALPFTQIVGGDISKDGKKILLKNYDHIYYWETLSEKPVVDILKLPHVEVEYKNEPQGEAIAWALEGDGFYTISEKNIGKKSYLYYYETNKRFKR